MQFIFLLVYIVVQLIRMAIIINRRKYNEESKKEEIITDIKVGEYIRTDKGRIFKVDEEKKILNIIDFLDVEYGKIKSHSENLIDLIEVGDIVNNHLVLAKWEFPQEIMIENEDEIKCRSYLKSSQIKTILTKEQYERNCYKVEE